MSEPLKRCACIESPLSDTQIIPHAFTITGAVAYSSISRAQLYVLMKDGDLPWSQVRGRRMILRESLDRLFVAKQARR